VLAHEVIQNLLGDIGSRVRHELRPVLGEQPEPLLAAVEERRERLEIGGFEEVLGFGPLQRSAPHLQLDVQVGDGVTVELLEDLA
jgi:hypothetical protein